LSEPILGKCTHSSGGLRDDPLHDGCVAATRGDEPVVVRQELDPGHLRAVAAARVVQRLEKTSRLSNFLSKSVVSPSTEELQAFTVRYRFYKIMKL